MSLLRRVFEVVEGRSVPVALIGGVALAAHGIIRATKDADLLATDLGLLDATRLLLSGPDGPQLRKTVEARALELPRRLQEVLKKLLSAERP